jgi:hypothetical protein
VRPRNLLRRSGGSQYCIDLESSRADPSPSPLEF